MATLMSLVLVLLPGGIAPLSFNSIDHKLQRAPWPTKRPIRRPSPALPHCPRPNKDTSGQGRIATVGTCHPQVLPREFRLARGCWQKRPLGQTVRLRGDKLKGEGVPKICVWAGMSRLEAGEDFQVDFPSSLASSHQQPGKGEGAESHSGFVTT